jgi:type IV pilus assembly protein PilA
MIRSSRQRGFTLVELMIVVAIIGVLSALALYGVSKYLSTARTAEAKYNVGAISKLAAGVYEREYAESELKAEGTFSKSAVNYLCSSALPVPATIPSGTKYQPNNAAGVDFHTGTSIDGWQCLGYTLSSPVYYQYNYVRGSGYISPAMGAPDPGAEGFEASAQGDVDADGTYSAFARSGAVVNKHLKLATQIFVYQEFE